MASIRHGFATAAATLMAAQPCLAAELAPGEGSFRSDAARQSGIYAGIYARVPLGQSGPRRAEPRAGLRLGPTHVYRGANASGGERRLQLDMVDVGLFRSGRPSLMVAGRQLVDREGRLRLQGEDGGGGGIPTWAIVVGGVVVAAGIGYYVLMEQFDCDEDEECS